MRALNRDYPGGMPPVLYRFVSVEIYLYLKGTNEHCQGKRTQGASGTCSLIPAAALAAAVPKVPMPVSAQSARPVARWMSAQLPRAKSGPRETAADTATAPAPAPSGDRHLAAGHANSFMRTAGSFVRYGG